MGILYDDDGPTPDEWTNMDLNRIAESIHRTRFVLVRNDDGTWSFGAPSMLSYSPRPGDMVPGETATAAMREWIQANAEDTAP